MPRAITIDPRTGRLVELILQTRNGRAYWRRLSDSLVDPASASPGTLRNWVRFAEGARRARGTPFTGPLPPAAEAVRAAYKCEHETPTIAFTLELPRLEQGRSDLAGGPGKRPVPRRE